LTPECDAALILLEDWFTWVPKVLFFLGHGQNAICRSWQRALIDQTALAVARDYALAQMVRHAPVAVWVIDDTGIPKKGSHSVGVARRYLWRFEQQGQLSGRCHGFFSK
jgi:hypothetical protein